MNPSCKQISTPSAEEQLGIACYVAEQKVCQSRSWTSQEKASRGVGILSRKDEGLLSVEMNISQAPSSFRQPVTQKKAFYPPFKIQVSACIANSETQIPMKVNAYSLTEDALVTFLKQVSHNRFPALPADTGLQNSCIYKCIENRESLQDRSSFVMNETFEFADMYFKSSSRMGLRWLLFVARVQGDLLCILYKYPTIVLSRKTDQYSKALSILKKSNPIVEFTDKSSGTCSQTKAPPPSASLSDKASGLSTNKTIPVNPREWILAAYGECHFPRALNQRDLHWLETKLGLTQKTSLSSTKTSTVPATEEDGRRFEDFANWYLSCLLSLKKESELWCSTDVVKVCPFEVDREVAEKVLFSQPIGTFLIRLSSEPGCFVLSIKQTTYQGEYVDHFLIDRIDLKQQTLSWWIMHNQQAHLFLDINSGAKFPKHMIFIDRIKFQSPNYMNYSSSYPPDGGIFSKDIVFRSTDSETYSFECL